MLVPITQSLGHSHNHFMVMDHWSQALDIALFETGTEKWSWMNEGGIEGPSFSCHVMQKNFIPSPQKIIGNFSSVTSKLGTFICQAWLASMWESVCRSKKVAAQPGTLLGGGMLAFYVYCTCTCTLSWVGWSTWYAASRDVGFLCLLYLYLYVKLSWVINLVRVVVGMLACWPLRRLLMPTISHF